MEASFLSLARLSLETTENERGLRMARDTTRAVLETAGIIRDRIDDCLLVVGELSGNVIQHARSSSGCFRVMVECRPDDVLLTISDSGIGFELSAIPPVGGVRVDGRVGGFGLPLVRTLCYQVDWYSSPDGTTVQAAVSLAPREEEFIPSLEIDLADFDDWEVDGFAPDSPGPRTQSDNLFRN